MTFLFDVNVLLAFMDSQHVAHADVHRWFENSKRPGWATCPITENGFIRILSTPSYPNPVRSAAIACDLLRQARMVEGHEFWTDDLSLVDAPDVDTTKVLKHGHVTDAYLLALARHRDGKLATLDRRLVTDSVKDGILHLEFIGRALQ